MIHSFSLVIEPVTDIPTWIVILVFFIPFAGGLGFYFYKTRHARSWRRGVYPASLKLSQDNLLEAYLALGSLLILLDYQKSKGKTQFINTYFNRYFKSANYNFGDSLLFSMNHPIQIDTVCNWLNLNLKTEGERAQVIYFLTGLALLDESLSEKELKFLQIMNSKLNLPIENLHRIIAIYQSYNEAEEQRKKETKQRSNKQSTVHYYEILNLPRTATQAEIKKAYRGLAKQHHPDLFATSSEAQQKMAEEKFLKIQEAYDKISSSLSV